MRDGLGLGCGILLLVVIAVLVLAARSYSRWLARQTPAGVWMGRGADGATVLVAFDGGPWEGVYRELRVQEGTSVRELGHWAVSGGRLHLMIMATDVPDHPRFGQDTIYRIGYKGTQQIAVNGPDRPGLELERAPPGTEVPIEPFTE
jgi:hypothetical protein